MSAPFADWAETKPVVPVSYKAVIVAALREQASEAQSELRHPDVSQDRYGLQQAYTAFTVVADWLDDEGTAVFDALAPVVSAERPWTEGRIEDAYWAASGDDWAIPRHVMVAFARALGIAVAVSS